MPDPEETTGTAGGLLGVASKIKKPVSLAALGFLVLYGIYRIILELGVFSEIGSNRTFLLLGSVVDYLFYLALVALVLGIAAYVYAKSLTVRRPKSTVVASGAGATAAGHHVTDDHARSVGDVGPTSVVVTGDGARIDVHPPAPAAHPPGKPLHVAPRRDGSLEAPRNNFDAADIHRNLDFVGRVEDLQGLYKDLAEGNVAVNHALAGEGGIGKSQLAVEFAFRFAGEFDGMWWLDASEAAIDAATSDLAQVLGLGLSLETPPEQVRAALCRRLSDARHLLILDNVEVAARLREFHLTGGSRLLATTRRTDLPTDLVHVRSLDVLDLQAAVKLLRKHRPDLAGDEWMAGFEAVAEYLGRHALAVALAAGYLRRYADVLPGPLLEMLKGAEIGDPQHILENLEPATSAAGYRLSVARCLSLHLPDETDDPAWGILTLAAFCHPGEIPVDVFVRGLAEAGLDERGVREGLARLADWSVLEYKQTVSIHRLTQSLVRNRLADDQARAAVSDLVALMAEHYWNEAFDDPARWPELDAYTPHAAAAAEHAEGLGTVLGAGRLANQVGCHVAFNRARYDAGLAVLRRAERINRAAFGDDHPAVAVCVSNIGSVLQDKSDLDGALAAFREAERIDRAAFGDDHPQVATDVNNIGGVLKVKGDFEGGLAAYREAERIDRAAFGDDHPGVATIVNNIGRVLQDQGDLDGALAAFREAERIDRAAFGDDHPQVATDVNNIGGVRNAKGDLDGALAAYREAERIQRAAFGDEHPKLAGSVSNIGTVLQDKGDVPGALAAFREAERIDRAAFGDHHPDVAICINNIAIVLFGQGKPEAAAELFQEAFEIQLRRLGPRALHTLNSARNLRACDLDPVALARRIAGDEAATEVARLL